MSVAEHITKFMTFLNIDFYMGWSFMDLINLGLLMLAVVSILNYVSEKAG
jgi:hypothetical protein